MNTREFRNDNENLKYPFKESATLVTPNGNLPRGFLVDVFLIASGNVFLSNITLSGALLSGTFSNEEGEVGTFSINREQIRNSKSDILLNGYKVGVVVMGDTADRIFRVVAQGDNAFSYDQTALETSVVIPPQIRVNAFVIDGIRVTGNVKFFEGAGIVLRTENGRIYFSAIGSSSQTTDPCCQESLEPIKSINQVVPTSGNLNIEPLNTSEPSRSTDDRQVLRVFPITGGIRLSLAR